MKFYTTEDGIRSSFPRFIAQLSIIVHIFLDEKQRFEFLNFSFYYYKYII